MSVKTVAQLKASAAVIRDETAIGGNTKTRIYNMLIDMIDSFMLILDISSVVTTGGTITFDFLLKQKNKFMGATGFATPKTIAFSNDTNALEFDFVLNITNVAAILTFPASVIMDDVRWEATGAQEWEPDNTGFFKGHAEFDGTNWLVDISKGTYT